MVNVKEINVGTILLRIPFNQEELPPYLLVVQIGKYGMNYINLANGIKREYGFNNSGVLYDFKKIY
jgi:hypothetical protein